MRYVNDKESIIKWLKHEKPYDWQSEQYKFLGDGSILHPDIQAQMSSDPIRITFLLKPDDFFLCKLHKFKYLNHTFAPSCRLDNCFFCQINKSINIVYTPVFFYGRGQIELLRVNNQFYDNIMYKFAKFPKTWHKRVWNLKVGKNYKLTIQNKHKSKLFYDIDKEFGRKEMLKWCKDNYNAGFRQYKSVIDARIISGKQYSNNDSEWDSVFSS